MISPPDEHQSTPDALQRISFIQFLSSEQGTYLTNFVGFSFVGLWIWGERASYADFGAKGLVMPTLGRKG